MKIASYLLALLFIFPTIGLCAHDSVRPAPPPELKQITSHFSELEESFEKQEWSEAMEHLNAANSLIGKLLPDFRKNTDRKDLNNFRKKFIDLKDNVQGRQYEYTEDGYIAMQKAYFILAESYAITPPLFLEVAGKYLAEAAESAEKNATSNVSAEMDEISEFIEAFDKQLSAHGIKDDDIESFLLTCYRVKKAADKGNRENVDAGLKKLKKLHATFIQAYK